MFMEPHYRLTLGRLNMENADLELKDHPYARPLDSVS